MANTFKPRRGLKSTMNNTKKTLVLEKGEMFVEFDSTVGGGKARLKFGDGTTQYSNLPYAIEDTNNRRGFYGTCATAAATAAKVVTLSSTTGWELVAGTIVGIKFTNANTAGSVTLNVNSSGAKSIWYNGAKYTGTEERITGWAGHVIYYMYDGTYWCFLNNDQNYINTNTTYSAGTGLSLSSTTFSLAASGVTAGSYGPSANVSGTDGTTINVPYITVDTYGRTTSISNKTYTSKDTKNTAGSTNTSSKIFLIGATSQAANPQTYSQDTAYVGTDGCLYSGGSKVLTAHDGNNRKSFYGTCSTAAGTAAKVVTLSDTAGWELKAGTIVAVKFTNTNTASNVTLNVNSSGAKSIYYNNAAYTGNSSTVCGYANRIYIYVYDGTYWVWVSHGVDDNTAYSLKEYTATPTDLAAFVQGTATGTLTAHFRFKDTNNVLTLGAQWIRGYLQYQNAYGTAYQVDGKGFCTTQDQKTYLVTISGKDTFSVTKELVKDTTYGVVSTSTNGLAPKVTDTSKFLKGDGTWATPTNTTYSAGAGLKLSGTTFSGNVPRVAKNANDSLPGKNTWILEEFTSGSNYGLPSNAWYFILSMQGADAGYGAQLALGMTSNTSYHRAYIGGTWQPWRRLDMGGNNGWAGNGVSMFDLNDGCYGTNPNQLPSQVSSLINSYNYFSSYGTLSLNRGADGTYPVIEYMDVFGQVARWNSNQNTWRPFRRPTGNATAAQVLSGYTFSNGSSDGISGSMPYRDYRHQYPVLASGHNGTASYVYIPYGYYDGVETANGTPASWLYITDAQVQGMHQHTGTYTYPSGSTGGTVDLGSQHGYRYVNASNVYNQGTAEGYNSGYNSGYSAGYTQGKSEGSGRMVLLQSGVRSGDINVSGYSDYRNFTVNNFVFKNVSDWHEEGWRAAGRSESYNASTGVYSFNLGCGPYGSTEAGWATFGAQGDLYLLPFQIQT